MDHGKPFMAYDTCLMCLFMDEKYQLIACMAYSKGFPLRLEKVLEIF